MDWIRRNWPDLLIGMGLLAVIAGIVATLLTGGTFFPLGASDRPQPEPASRATDAGPPVPGQGTPVVTPAGTTPAGTEETAGGSPVTIPNLPSIGQPDEPQASAGGQPQDAPAVVALRPGDPAAQPDPAPAARNPLQPATPDPAPAAAGTEPAAAAAAPPAAPSAAAATQAEDPEAPYRVSVGSFRSAENAQRQAELFRQAGYPVFLAEQGELNLVLLGPYRLETEAERVRTAVANGGFDVAPIIYTFRPDEAGTATPATEPAAAQPQPAVPAAATTSTAPAAVTTSTAPAPAAAASPPAAAPTASAAGRYLQAGAYSSQENAQLQRSAIEALGFRVTVQQDGNLSRILVGPYGENDLTSAQGSLARQGIESIPVPR